MSSPASAMMARASIGLTPGISAGRAAAGSTGASGPVPASGPVVPSALMPQAAGIAAAICSIRAFSWLILPSRAAIWSGSRAASSPWWSSNMPSRASANSSCLAFIPVRARAASTLGSRCPAIIALTMSCADTVASLLATLGSLTSALSSSFTRPLPAPGALLGQPGAGPGAVPQIPDWLGRHEGRAQQPHLGQPGQPLRVQFVRFGPAGQGLGPGRIDQLHRQPARLQHQEPDPPVIAGGLQGHHLDPVVLQLAAQRADRAHPGLDRPDRALPGAGPGRVRHAGARHPGVLRHVGRAGPVMNPLVFLVVDNLRPLPCSPRSPPMPGMG
jgi:hypothetical protein